MKIELSKERKILVVIGAILIFLMLAVGILGSSKTDSTTKTSGRVRREQIPKSQLTTTTVVVTATVSTKAVTAGNPVAIPTTDFILGALYSDAPTIKAKWTQAELCSLLSGTAAQNLLGMTVVPVPTYVASDTNGVKCTYADGEGDEISFQFSVSSFTTARTIDTALNDIGENVVLDNGAYGVAKTSKANGYTLSLNLFGQDQNEVIVVAPDEKTGKNAAIIISDAIKLHG